MSYQDQTGPQTGAGSRRQREDSTDFAYPDDEPEPPRPTLSRVIAWCGKSRAKWAAVEILMRGDRRKVREIAREFKIDQCKVYQAVRDLRAKLKTLVS